MELNIRGRKIRCYAKPGQVAAYVKLYSAMPDEMLDALEAASKEHEKLAIEGRVK